MKRWMLFVLAGLMLAVISPTCGPTGYIETAAPPTQAVEATAPPEPTIEKTVEVVPETAETISFWTWAPAYASFERDALDQMVIKFQEQYPNVKVDLLVIQ